MKNNQTKTEWFLFSRKQVVFSLLFLPFNTTLLRNFVKVHLQARELYLIDVLCFQFPNNKMLQNHLLFSQLHHPFFNGASVYESVNHHLKTKYKGNLAKQEKYWKCKFAPLRIKVKTLFLWPSRCALAIACRSAWGFQSLQKQNNVSSC